MTNIGIATNRKILDLFNGMKTSSLILRPSFQRKLVWNNKHKEAFIDTILKGFPFPEIYLADGEIDLETQTSKVLVVDGQQRLNTIYQYITASNEFKVKTIATFNDLSPTEKTSFYDYVVVVRELGRIDEEKIKEIFKRINSVQYALNAMEIQNALYEGEFIHCAKQIISNSDFSQIEIFSESEYSRMRDWEYMLLIMATIEEGGYFTGTKEIEKYIIRYDDEYPKKNETIKKFLECIKLIKELEIQPDSLWLQKSSFFNLIIELLLFHSRHGFFIDKRSLKLELQKLENTIILSKDSKDTNNKYYNYYRYTFSGTASRTARIARGEVIRDHLETLK